MYACICVHIFTDTVSAYLSLQIQIPWANEESRDYTSQTRLCSACFGMRKNHEQCVLLFVPVYVLDPISSVRMDWTKFVCGRSVDVRIIIAILWSNEFQFRLDLSLFNDQLSVSS